MCTVPKKTTLKEIGEMVAHIVKHMVTKDDILPKEQVATKSDIASLQTELKGDILALGEQMQSIEQS